MLASCDTPLEIDRAGPWVDYSALLAEVRPGRVVADCVVGLVWTLILTDAGDAGVALTFCDGLDASSLPGSVVDSDLLTAASWITSWNLYEAALGCASINAALNTRSHIEEMTGRQLEEFVVSGGGLFNQLAREFAGAKVAVVGHFAGIEKMASHWDLTILERHPGPGDTPDTACEYLLPKQDLVCITGSALTNKTLPRLLELSRSAFTVLVGPSTPMTPIWFDLGVNLLAGAVVTDPLGVRRCVQEGAHRRVFREGLTTIAISAEDVAGF
jgi:uncharacterized protein (DUF4213/DUF364 family)